MQWLASKRRKLGHKLGHKLGQLVIVGMNCILFGR
jgi:hypothetical protein